MVPGPSSEETEQLLRDLPDFKILGLLHGASNYTFLAQLGPHQPSGLRVAYKPTRGESPIRDYHAEPHHQREDAAYPRSRHLCTPRNHRTDGCSNTPHAHA